MTVLLGVLARIGKVLLIILLVILILVLCLLFTPFWYSGFFRKKGPEIRLKAGVRWLFSILYARVLYDGDEMKPEVYLIGIPMLRVVRFFKEKQKKKEPASGSGKKKQEKKQKESLISRLKKAWDLLRSETFREAKEVITKEGREIFKAFHLKIKGDVEFGLDDPAATGMVLGVIGAVYPVLPEELKISPDFTEQKLEADIRFSGHFFLIVLLVHMIRILKSPAVRKLIRSIRKPQKKETSRSGKRISPSSEKISR